MSSWGRALNKAASLFLGLLDIVWWVLQAKMGTSKDADMSPFEAGRRLLSSETARMSLLDRTELVFQDMDLVPLLIQVDSCRRGVSTTKGFRHPGRLYQAHD